TARLYGREKVNGNGFKSRVPLPKGAKRLIVGNSCEKGLVEDVNDMRQIKKELDDICADSPNLVEISAREIFATHTSRSAADPLPRFAITGKTRARRKAMERRKSIRIGIPRLMNMYSLAPVFTAYFESLGIPFRNIVFSDFSSEKLYKEGAKRGAIDPCYPSKLGIPHVHNLLFKKHKRTPLDIIFFPMLDDLPTDMVNTVASRACPTVTTTPEAVKAAFIKEGDLFAENGITFMDTFLNMGSPLLFERQMYNQFRDVLGLSRNENARAIQAGFEALRLYQEKIRRQSRELLDRLEREQRLGIVLLARPYHNDPGINHEILFDLQKQGYPIFTHDNLPMDEDILDRLFGEEIREGVISHPMDISDVWKNSYSENTNRKIWAAKFTARHPNLVALEMSNFKCGHDAPIYTVIEEIIERSGTPYFNFKDLDENKPAGSIKIRVETILYFLKRYREELFASREHRARIEPHFTGYDRDSLLKHSGEVAASARLHHPDGDEAHTEHAG
ncbi:MAG: CoA activase, partial [Chlorobi bacterium]|nr:CoA activase [Chlorobiota bacterium]